MKRLKITRLKVGKLALEDVAPMVVGERDEIQYRFYRPVVPLRAPEFSNPLLLLPWQVVEEQPQLMFLRDEWRSKVTQQTFEVNFHGESPADRAWDVKFNSASVLLVRSHGIENGVGHPKTFRRGELPQRCAAARGWKRHSPFISDPSALLGTLLAPFLLPLVHLCLRHAHYAGCDGLHLLKRARLWFGWFAHPMSVSRPFNGVSVKYCHSPRRQGVFMKLGGGLGWRR